MGQSLYVSIHAPVKDATSEIKLGMPSGNSFNPRTRKGCDRDKFAGCLIKDVSIHAPVKDATQHQS